ncbi:MAG: gamma-glutamylcyclotransferase family protein [Planctomycetota bacterium]
MREDTSLDDTVLTLVNQCNAARRGRNNGLAAQQAFAAEQALESSFRCSQQLAVYGTLAPGESNHHLLANCPGTWCTATVLGRRTVRHFPAFTYDATASPVPVHLLTSTRLPGHWRDLDAFEGPDYRRILVPVRLESQRFTIANLYEAALLVPPA